MNRERCTLQTGHYSHDFVPCDLPHVGLRCSGPPLCHGQEAQDMKPSKQIPMRRKIDVLIIIVGLGVIALGIVITTARIFGTPVQEYARLIPF
jgi:hypothetical protein